MGNGPLTRIERMDEHLQRLDHQLERIEERQRMIIEALASWELSDGDDTDNIIPFVTRSIIKAL